MTTHYIVVEQFEPESDTLLRRWRVPFIGTDRQAVDRCIDEAKRLRANFGGIENWYVEPVKQ